jgi:tRNA (cytidine/uridine-2'-O-)-methyltransferase
MLSSEPLHIVLVEPEIPQNAGNIGRTCVALGARLHLVGKLGFSLDDAAVKRAGLDYWEHLRLTRHDTWDAFEAARPAGAAMVFLSTKATRDFWDVELASPLYLVFGSESRGLPPSFYDRYRDRLARLPQRPEARSLNLAVAVGAAGYDAARRLSIIAR